MAKSEKACAIIIYAFENAPLRIVMDVGDDPGHISRLLDALYASNRTLSRIAVQTPLFRMSYNGQNMSNCFDQLATLFSQLDRWEKDAAIPDLYRAPMRLESIDPICFLDSTAAALRTREISEQT